MQPDRPPCIDEVFDIGRAIAFSKHNGALLNITLISLIISSHTGNYFDIGICNVQFR